MNCIYCNSQGPFNEEHVIPASLGGDDRPDWILKDCVCKDCNDSFSKIELEVSRRSDIAVARKELQKSSRNRGKNTNKPTIIFESSFIFDKKSNFILDCIAKEGGGYQAVPQLLILQDFQVAYIGSDESYSILYQKLKKFKYEGGHIIEKTKSTNGHKYKIINIQFPENTYETKVFSLESLKGINNIVWLKPYEMPDDFENTDISNFPSRICLENEHISARTISIDFLLEHIINICSTDGIIEIPESKETRAITTISTIDLNGIAHARFYAKTAINIIAKLYGADVAGQPQFRQVRRHARYAEGELQVLNRNDVIMEANLPLGDPIEHHHVFRITIINIFNSYNLVMYARFYDLTIENVVLGSFDHIPDFFKGDVYIHCNYNENKIKAISGKEHKQLTNQVIEKMPKSIIIWFVVISTTLLALFIYISSLN